MTLRTKILLFITGCIAVFYALVLALTEFILLPGADRAEAQAMVLNLRRLESRLDNRLIRLTQAGTDWAYWDDAGDFIEGRNPARFEKSLEAPSFKESEIDLLVLWDVRDRPRLGLVHQGPPKEPTAIPPDLLAELAALRRIFQRQPDGELRGLIRTSLGVLLLSAQPVTGSKWNDPVRGTVAVGKFLSETQLAELREHEPYSITLLSPGSTLAGLDAPLAIDGARSAHVGSETELVGRWSLADLNGEVAAVVELRSPRVLHLQQRRSIRLVFWTLGIGSVVLVVVVGVLVDVLFLRRLYRMQKEVRELRDEAGIQRLEATDGTPEFRTLGRNIAAMARGMRAAQLHAETASRAKGVFLATMSHEIRTPMTGVLGYTSLLRGTPLTVEQREYVTTIEQSGEILLALINDILDLSKLESGRVELERQPVVLHDLVAEIGVLFSPRLVAKQVALVLDIAAEVPAMVVGDALRLRQVLFNLVGNAAKFTQEGQVQIRIRRKSGAPAPPDGECVLQFEVVDTGIGLTSEQRTRLFEPFSQADSSTTRVFGGTGLGLAISQRLVKAMGGEIGVESEANRGARFYFSLRFRLAETPVVEAKTTAFDAVPDLPCYGGRILVVEDNVVNRRMMSIMLRRVGCAADYAENGREAVAKVTAANPAFDLIIMDVVMPEMDGLDATRAIRVHELVNRRSPVWIVALTASAMVEDRERCHSVGMDDFLAKPIRLGELIAALERATLNKPAG